MRVELAGKAENSAAGGIYCRGRRAIGGAKSPRFTLHFAVARRLLINRRESLPAARCGICRSSEIGIYCRGRRAIGGAKSPRFTLHFAVARRLLINRRESLPAARCGICRSS